MVLNAIPMLTKAHLPKVEQVIVKILIASVILFILFILLQQNDYRIKGIYTFPFVSLTVIVSSLFYFVLFKNTKRKIVTIFLLIPLIIFCILTLIVGQVLHEFKIDDTYNIAVSKGGFLSCGENISITRSALWIFDKEVFSTNNLCLREIYNIETLKLDENHAEFLIYHNGHESENPYLYEVERKNSW